MAVFVANGAWPCRVRHFSFGDGSGWQGTVRDDEGLLGTVGDCGGLWGTEKDDQGLRARVTVGFCC